MPELASVDSNARQIAPTPRTWRVGLFGVVALLAALAMTLSETIPAPARSLLGIVAFLALAVACSRNIRAINIRVVLAGFLLQLILAVLITQIAVVQRGFQEVGHLVTRVVDYSQAGAGLLFGPLADRNAMQEKFGPNSGVPFGIILTCTVIFVACLFSILYHLRILQAVVWVFAKLMVLVMGQRGVSGAESLSAAANVFMGQTEAPLIVRPYVAGMTKSELLAIMIGGMATIAGGVMAIYISMGANAAAILATSVMAAPCGLYISKILWPEDGTPETRGDVKLSDDRPDTDKPANIIDAAARGASDGMMLSINIIAMLIAFLAVIAALNAGLKIVDPSLSLELIFSRLFAPVAALSGVDSADVPRVGELLGIKLVGNEFLAFDNLTKANWNAETKEVVGMSVRSYALATFALTGFANISSIGIQLGGIGAMAPNRRKDLARLGALALLGGFLATLINASVAGLLMG